MYILADWKKEDPLIRWNLPDRIFFGHGACHILAGVFMLDKVESSFKPYWIKPIDHPGMHVFVNDGEIAFDYHGYSALERLKKHHWKVWRHQYPSWDATVTPVDFNLLSTSDLNQQNMRGPDQYYGDPTQRARNFIARVDHCSASQQVRILASV